MNPEAEPPSRLIEDVAAASAAYLFNLLPAIAGEPDATRYERLHRHFVACLMAYRDGLTGWGAMPSPSLN